MATGSFPSGKDYRRYGALAVVLGAIVLSAWVRFRLAEVPLERDEGEYAYAGQLILGGTPPYTLAYNMKFPGIYYAYSLSMALLGATPWGIHVGLLLVNAGTILLVFAITRRLTDDFSAAIAAATFALLSLGQTILGLFGHATHYVLLPALAGFLILLRVLESKREARIALIGSGALLAVAVLMKQHAVFFLPLAGGLIVWKGGGDLRAVTVKLGALALGVALPFALVCLVFLDQGVLGRFWFWTFRYAREYVTQVPISYAVRPFVAGLEAAVGANVLLWLLAVPGLAALWLGRWSPLARVFVTGLLGASFLGLCPGFYFRQHYFILLLPAVAMLAGIALGSVRRGLERLASPAAACVVAAALFALVTALSLYGQRDFLFSMSAQEASRTTYGFNPFPESVEIARYIKAHTGTSDRIAVLGSEPEIYFYADRVSATGYIYTYPLMEPQRYASEMQGEMIREIEGAHPKYLVYVQMGVSWLVRPGSDRKILEWANGYTAKCFDLAGIVDISENGTKYLWDDQVQGARPSTDAVILVFRRKAEGEPCAVGEGTAPASTSPPGRHG